MERKQIKKNEDNKSEVESRLKNIETSIQALTDKLSDKWVLPVVVVIITALMTAANYFITRHFANEDIYGNKLKEKIAELRASQTINFFNNSIGNLDTLNKTFHSICIFGPSKIDDDQFNKTAIKIKALVDQQITMDRVVVGKMKAYQQFVVEEESDLEDRKLDSKTAKVIYDKSNKLYIDCINSINASLNTLTQK